MHKPSKLRLARLRAAVPLVELVSRLAEAGTPISLAHLGRLERGEARLTDDQGEAIRLALQPTGSSARQAVAGSRR